MGRFFAIRHVFRLIFVFGRSLYRGEPWAYWIVLGIAVLGIVAWFVGFARRPLGGDPDRTPTDESEFTDAKNPYRDVS